MAFDEDRRQRIIKDIADTAGLSAVIDYCSSTNELLAALLRSGETITQDVVSQFALHQCLQEVVCEVYHVNPEIFELEKQKCYINFEEIMDKAKEQAAKEAAPNVVSFTSGFVANATDMQPGDIEQVIGNLMKSIEAPVQAPEVVATVDTVVVDDTQSEKVEDDGSENDG